MTKKLFARQQRDEARNQALRDAKAAASDNTPIWDEINGIHNMFVQSLNSYVEFVNVMKENQHLTPFFKEPGLVANYINTLCRDHVEIKANMEKIHSSHAGKSGASTEFNDVTLAMALGNEYAQLGQQINAILEPTVAQLTVFVREAEEAYIASQQESSVEVVTDVAFTESSVTE